MIPTPPADHVAIGRLGRTFRVRGDMRVYLTSPDHAQVLENAASARTPLFVEGIGPTRVRAFGTVGDQAMIAFEGIHDPESARRHVNATIYAPSHALPLARDDGAPTRWLDAPVHLDGAPFGRVVRVDVGPQILLAVATEGGEHLLPWGAPYVQPRAGVIEIVDPPTGLLDEPR